MSARNVEPAPSIVGGVEPATAKSKLRAAKAAPLTPLAKATLELADAPSAPVVPSKSAGASTLSPTNMAKDFSTEPSFASSPRPAAPAERPAGNAAASAQPAQPAPVAVSPRSLLREAEEKLSLLRDNREIFEWILEKQSSLRTEFVGFLKKDLREIDYVVSDINTKGDRGDFASNALELIKNTYIKHWEKSFELISPDNVLQRSDDER